MIFATICAFIWILYIPLVFLEVRKWLLDLGRWTFIDKVKALFVALTWPVSVPVLVLGCVRQDLKWSREKINRSVA